MRQRRIIRVMAAIALSFYVLMPHAAFGFNLDSDCECLANGNPCGERGVPCHCCKEKSGDTIGGTFIAKCRMVSTEFSIAHPPAISAPIETAITEHAQASGIIYAVSLFDDISIAPPLRPPDALPLN